MTTPKPKIVELSMDEWEAMLQRAQSEPLNEAECERLKALGESYIYLLKLLEDKRITIDRLRRLFVRLTAQFYASSWSLSWSVLGPQAPLSR